MADNTESVPKKPFNPIQFLREVRQEMDKVTWPTRKETMISSAMVLILIMIAAIFFLAADTIIGSAVQWILGMGK